MGTHGDLYFDDSFLGDRARLLQCLQHAYLEGFRGPFEKWWPDRLAYATIFKRVLENIRIKIRHLKGENNWESSGGLDSNGLEI